LLKEFSHEDTDTYRILYDNTYTFALFCEFSICYQLCKEDQLWYDLVSKISISDPDHLREIEMQRNVVLHHNAEAEYEGSYTLYLNKWKNTIRKNYIRRQTLVFLFHARLFLRKILK
jgi:hypothetical protein